MALVDIEKKYALQHIFCFVHVEWCRNFETFESAKPRKIKQKKIEMHNNQINLWSEKRNNSKPTLTKKTHRKKLNEKYSIID